MVIKHLAKHTRFSVIWLSSFSADDVSHENVKMLFHEVQNLRCCTVVKFIHSLCCIVSLHNSVRLFNLPEIVLYNRLPWEKSIIFLLFLVFSVWKCYKRSLWLIIYYLLWRRLEDLLSFEIIRFLSEGGIITGCHELYPGTINLGRKWETCVLLDASLTDWTSIRLGCLGSLKGRNGISD